MASGDGVLIKQTRNAFDHITKSAAIKPFRGAFMRIQGWRMDNSLSSIMLGFLKKNLQYELLPRGLLDL